MYLEDELLFVEMSYIVGIPFELSMFTVFRIINIEL